MSWKRPGLTGTLVVGGTILVLVAALLATTRSGQLGARPGATSATGADAAPTGGRRTALAAEWGIAGAGSQVTAAFDLPDDPVVFALTCSCSGAFQVRLLSEDGRPTLLLADGRGSATTDKTVQVARPGTYALQIEAVGAWEITVRLPAEHQPMQTRERG